VGTRVVTVLASTDLRFSPFWKNLLPPFSGHSADRNRSHPFLLVIFCKPKQNFVVKSVVTYVKCELKPHISYKTMLPEFGHNSQVGFVTPARHASQNHGSVEHDDIVLDTLAVSDTP
jgi:Fe-S cluster assembly scaffold protein SufB